jgi:IS30 family transposase
VVSHETIYQYIYTGNGRFSGWYHYLRRGQRYRQPRQQRKRRKPKIPQRISIHDRPGEINTRQRYGDWETDSMVFSKQKDRLSVQYERKSQLVRIHKVQNGSAQATLDALRDSVESLPSAVWQSCTFDNGTEGVQHLQLTQDYGIPTYFCDPYASWQKGGVENMNGLIRQYLPRSTNLSTTTDAVIQRIEDRLNNRPRKGLNYKTPNQVIQSYLQEVVHC